VEPVTHALFSLGIARAGQRRLPRFGTAMLLASGLAPEFDFLSYFGGAGAYLRWHHAAMHSLVGGAVTACAVAGTFCVVDRKLPSKTDANRRGAALTFGTAALVCALGVFGHVLLDLVSGVGVQLLWPFSGRWFGWPLSANLDLGTLVLLCAGLLLPLLFKLVNEEVGAQKKRSGRAGAAITLALLTAYFGARAELRSRAIDMLLAREYRGEIPLQAGAFPESSTPLVWRGLAATDNTIEQAEVGSGLGVEFDTARTLTHFKPGESPALDAAERTEAARRFLVYAKFPLASVEHREAGYRVEIRDLRFPGGDTSADNMIVRVDLNSDARVTAGELRFASDANP
jgi:membrane-bound metal-dependent hydrolase YbcI (DUF457 family)